MEHAYDVVCSFSSVDCFIYEIVDLRYVPIIRLFNRFLIKLHLSGYCLTAHTKDCTLAWGEKIHRPWLLWVTGIVHLLSTVNINVFCIVIVSLTYLLSHIEAKVHGDVIGSMWQACVDGWNLKLTIHSKCIFQDLLGSVNRRPVKGPLLCGQAKVGLGVFQHLPIGINVRYPLLNSVCLLPVTSPFQVCWLSA